MNARLDHVPVPCTVLYGPDRVELRPGASGFCSVPGVYAYHGVVPRGLLSFARRRARAAAEWAAVAPALDAALNGARCEANDVLEAWVQAARTAGVLSFRSSAGAIERFVRTLIAEGAFAPAGRIELWHQKEGHTASVWRVHLEHGAGRPATIACLQVARDDQSSSELQQTSRLLAHLHTRDPVHVVRVRRISTVPSDAPCCTPGVAVTWSDWLEGASELHRVLLSSGRPVLVAVERFVGPDAGSAQQRILGIPLGDPETERLLDELRGFLFRHSREMEDGRIWMPALELNQGDLVWWRGHMVVVGLSMPGPPVCAAERRRRIASLCTGLTPDGRATDERTPLSS